MEEAFIFFEESKKWEKEKGWRKRGRGFSC